MKKNDFAQYIADFLTKYLAGTRNLSANTITSYRDAFVILLTLMNDRYSIKPEKLGIIDFSPDRIKEFLSYLETGHGNSISTRNQRLIAIHSFFRYISTQNPEYMFLSQQILAIPEKKKEQKLIRHFETGQVKELLAAPDTHTSHGRRDQALLCLLYDSGCRVQELADIKVCDIRLTVPAQVTVTGKGRKTPHVLRHSKAMHMAEADINPVYIRDFLGHTDLKVTQIYSKTSVEMKRRALDKLKGTDVIPKKPQKDWTEDKNLMDWLSSLGH